MKVKVKEYIDNLTKEEEGKPLYQRKPIPAATDIAKAAGVSRQAAYGFLNRSHHKRIDLDLLDKTIALFRGYGHNTQLTDVLEYIEE